jgi:transcriptional regulator with XRE-family HTH domain
MQSTGTNPLGERLEAERRRRGMTLTDFACEVLGIDPSLLSRYISGKRSPGRRNARRVAAALGLSPAEMEELVPERPRVPDDEASLRAELGRVRAMLEDLHAARARGAPVVAALAGPPPVVPALGSRALRPVIVADESLVAAGVRAGSVVWIAPADAAPPGKVVRVGTDEPPLLRVRAADDPDPVTGVAFLIQWVP